MEMNLPANAGDWVRSLGREDLLEEERTTHISQLPGFTGLEYNIQQPQNKNHVQLDSNKYL